METPTDDPTEFRRLAIRLPRPLWIAVATVELIVVPTALRSGGPVHRKHVAG